MAKRMLVDFRELVLDSLDYGSDDQHMVSRAFFHFEMDGQRTFGLFCNVKQAVGSYFEQRIIEVSKPVGFLGPFDYDSFKKAVEDYFRICVGPDGRLIAISPGARMYNVAVSFRARAWINAPGKSSTGW